MRFGTKDLAAAAVFVALIVGFVVLIGGLTHTGSDQEAQLVYDAVKNAALTCYAVEGAYPEDVEYLRQNYGLAYDRDRYMVSYDAAMGNMVPVIYVTEVEANA